MNLLSKPNNRRFLLIFFGVFSLGYALLFLFPPVLLEEQIAGGVGRYLGLHAESNRIQLGGHEFLIGESCTGFVSVLMLASIVLGLRKPAMEKKLVVIGAGGVLLLGLNLVRVTLVIAIGQRFGIGAAEIAHVLSWFAVSGLVIGLALLAVARLVPPEQRKDLL